MKVSVSIKRKVTVDDIFHDAVFGIGFNNQWTFPFRITGKDVDEKEIVKSCNDFANDFIRNDLKGNLEDFEIEVRCFQ
jgi:hypothetical protein